MSCAKRGGQSGGISGLIPLLLSIFVFLKKSYLMNVPLPETPAIILS